MNHIVFNNVKYYKNKKTGYYSNSKLGMLHRDVWEFYNSKIKKGYHVHHIDGNKDNNSIENLELKLGSKHLSDHMTKEKKEFARKVINEVARPKAIEWHKSPPGIEWHKQHFENYLKKAIDKAEKNNCAMCFKEYSISSTCKHKGNFCSNACKSKHRRKQKLDDIEKECPVCSMKFKTNKYRGSETCSRVCGTKLRIFRRNGIPW